MPIVIIILAIAAFITLFVLAAKYAAKKERERQEALTALSQRLNLVFNSDNPGEWSLHQHFNLFTRGHSRRSFNTMRGTIALPDGQPLQIVTGDYTYKTEEGSGKNRRTVTHNVSYMIVRPPFVFVAQLSFRKEGFFDKFAGAIGFDDIDFESSEFSKKYFVKCDDRKFAYDLFDPRMIQWILDAEPPANLQSSMGEMLVSLTTGGRWKPEQFELLMNWTRDFYSRWPRHLVDRLKNPQITQGLTQ